MFHAEALRHCKKLPKAASKRRFGVLAADGAIAYPKGGKRLAQNACAHLILRRVGRIGDLLQSGQRAGLGVEEGRADEPEEAPIIESEPRHL